MRTPRYGGAGVACAAGVLAAELRAPLATFHERLGNAARELLGGA